jgi:hypothetical protein
VQVPEVAEGEEESSAGGAATTSFATAANASAAGAGGKEASSTLAVENQQLRAKLDKLTADYSRLQQQVGGLRGVRGGEGGCLGTSSTW